MAVTYSNVLQSSATIIDDSATSSTLSTYVPAGLLEAVTYRFKGTSATAIATGDPMNIFSQFVGRFNGNQAYNLQALAPAATIDDISRLSAIVESLGGSVSGEASATAWDFSLTFPLGLNLPNQTRFETDIRTVAASAAPSTQTMEVIFKYGASNLATIYGNPTTENLSTAQTMVQVKIPDFGKNARVIGIAVQEPQAGSDKISEIICKPLGDFGASPAQWRARAGVLGGNQLYYPDLGSDDPYTFATGLSGFHWLPCYNLDVSATGQVTLLITASEALTNVQFMPVIALPTSGEGERSVKQTAVVSTSGSDSSLYRAEE